MIEGNIGELIAKLSDQLKEWVDLPHTWFGRISVIKMNVLLHILFTFLNMPIGIFFMFEIRFKLL